MSPVEMCFLFLITGIAVKALVDSFKFWEYSDEMAILDAEEARLKAQIRMIKANKKAVRVTRTPNRSNPNIRVNSRPVTLTNCRTEVLRDKRVPDRRMKKAA